MSAHPDAHGLREHDMPTASIEEMKWTIDCLSESDVRPNTTRRLLFRCSRHMMSMPG